ncbi:hypothetical protein VOM14_13790 [Paraburkholderia sp. MPAMCS5]|uniref:hypothetical protein n=1 Tax=Paraburkholderia sp. MPAMCS5 TaxID=3112563 RepID=UPI002E18477E|nr:hypothetical protein [Paraburkholderia sp. MPAMCS5]
MANFDYRNDAAFGTSISIACAALLAVLCGASKEEQQATMFGLPSSMRTQPVFTGQLPSIVARERSDVPSFCNSPSSGAWPFSTKEGVTHYYGAGAYGAATAHRARFARMFI